jgi:hypothetical protein
MGTRSLTFVYEKYGEVQKPVCNMYRQFDGYPTGHGAELAEFLNGGRLVNGLIHTKTAEEVVFNGMGCLAASMVAHFKQSPGGFYIHPTDVTDCGQDYEYHIYNDNGLLSGSVFRIEVYNCGCNFFGMSGDSRELEFKGNLKEFTEFCSEKKKATMTTQKNVFDGSDIGKDWLKSVLRDGVAVVKFEKNDGTERVMKCTLKQDLVPQKVYETKRINEQVRAVSDEVLPVYDVEANGWRSFRWDSIKSVEIGL